MPRHCFSLLAACKSLWNNFQDVVLKSSETPTYLDNLKKQSKSSSVRSTQGRETEITPTICSELYLVVWLCCGS